MISELGHEAATKEQVAAIMAAVFAVCGDGDFQVTGMAKVEALAPAWGSGEGWRMAARLAATQQEGVRR